MKIKKLLSLMSITACATVSSSSVVACGGGEVSSENISKRLIKEVQSFNEVILSSESKDDTKMKEAINKIISDKEETITKIIDIFCKELNKQNINNQDFLNYINALSKIINSKDVNMKETQEAIKKFKKIDYAKIKENISKSDEFNKLKETLVSDFGNYKIIAEKYTSKLKQYKNKEGNSLAEIISSFFDKTK